VWKKRALKMDKALKAMNAGLPVRVIIYEVQGVAWTSQIRRLPVQKRYQMQSMGSN
jgi:hypothetical protein